MANTYSDMPGLADLPIIGPLFRSSTFQNNQSELVVIVTPYIVKPTSDPNALKVPTDKLHHASALEALLFKRLNRPDVDTQNVNMINADPLYGAAGFNLED